MNRPIEEVMFYHIYPLGFTGAPAENDANIQLTNRLSKVGEWVPHLKEMNINALYIGPIFESTSHGYDTKDYYKIDKRLGTNEDFKELCKELHESDIDVVLDAVFNHVGREFEPFLDLREKRENSYYRNWFTNVNFSGNNSYGDNFSYESWHGCYNLVKLNLRNPEVKNYIFKVIEFWIKEFDIDGLRLDAADCMDFEFLKELSRFTKSLKKDFWLVGEVIHGDYNRWANKDSIDSVTNYECYKGLYSSHNDKNYFEIAYSFNRQSGNGGIYKNLNLYNFVDNHDVNRLASTVIKEEYLKNIYTLLYTMPGIPSIYYGSEYGIKAVKGKGTDAPLRPCLELGAIEDANADLFEHIKKIAEVRANSKALCYGDYKQVVVKNQQFVFERVSEGEDIYIALNLEDKESVLEFKIATKGNFAENLIEDEEFTIENQSLKIKLEPFSSKILRIASI
ncbi:alpha-amylase family glycosyl hydrolase [Clostridium cellulovorans]|uniref:Alpha amylase catalytic region n=1 Tax=Clostridium cellulovorans (strain ATCC 35296 / DSM 3052 / OCM 3 / 743B) TaxID=573061 RepID=D9SM90_CLOC7|nr:alpha-amylase family glycosyl hydrolase [Clostridium cellulovorans]ADL53746.1 alpha amylase catalytic region [Clostridium cellulovorans 743B]